jgi:flagellar assembly protein FliH
MSGPAKFMFENDFRNDRRSRISDADVLTAERNGREAGFVEGLAHASSEIQAQYAAAAAELAQQMAHLLASSDQRSLALEDAAIRIAVDLARRIAAAALAERPQAALEDAARAALGHARGAPHLAVRVHDTLVDEMDKLFARLCRETGFGGRVIVLGEPDITPGEARMEWADGGILVNQAGLDTALQQALASIFDAKAHGDSHAGSHADFNEKAI